MICRLQLCTNYTRKTMKSKPMTIAINIYSELIEVKKNSIYMQYSYSNICARLWNYFALYLYYFYVYCFTVLITPCSSIYSHALYCINSRQYKFITTLAIVAPRYVTNCLFVVLHCTTFHDYG